MKRPPKPDPLAVLLASVDAEYQHAQELVRRAQNALDAAIQQALVAKGKLAGVTAAQDANRG